MAKLFLHAYVAKGATPTVADEINGETMEIEESEYRKNPEYWEQKCVDNFIKWLKGKPESLRDEAEVIKGKGYDQWAEVSHAKTIQIAEQRREQKKAGKVGELHGVSVNVTKRLQIVFKNIKSGRFVSRKTFENS